ncbi:MAG: tol-pal system protein YbgF [Alphaproteobacteria bacterium]|nr:MAG: tol-pal system protein YbgF [Alphaproteobacteria bacterium]
MTVYTLKHTLRVASAFGLIAVMSVVAEPASLQAQPYDSSAAAAAEVRFQQMEKEIRRLTGQVEEQNYEIRRLRDDLAKRVDDLEMRLRDAGQSGGGNISVSSSSGMPYIAPSSNSAKPSAPTPSQETKKPNSSFQYQPPSGAPQALGTINKSQSTGAVSKSSDSAPRAYDYAYSFIKARDFNRAEREFAKFMTEYPNHPLVSNAKYWYGETFYVRGEYEKSARIFAEGYQQFPKGPKAASNLLKLGMALTGMGKTADACIAYKQLKKDYAQSSVSVLKRASTEMKRINCR